MIMELACTLTGLAAIVVALRFYVGKKNKRQWGWDDWLMLLAVVSLDLPGD
jgi:hypothetical protein